MLKLIEIRLYLCFELILNQSEFRLFPNQSENGEYNLFRLISSELNVFLCVGKDQKRLKDMW